MPLKPINQAYPPHPPQGIIMKPTLLLLLLPSCLLLTCYLSCPFSSSSHSAWLHSAALFSRDAIWFWPPANLEKPGNFHRPHISHIAAWSLQIPAAIHSRLTLSAESSAVSRESWIFCFWERPRSPSPGSQFEGYSATIRAMTRAPLPPRVSACSRWASSPCVWCLSCRLCL